MVEELEQQDENDYDYDNYYEDVEVRGELAKKVRNIPEIIIEEASENDRPDEMEEEREEDAEVESLNQLDSIEERTSEENHISINDQESEKQIDEKDLRMVTEEGIIEVCKLLNVNSCTKNIPSWLGRNFFSDFAVLLFSHIKII